MAANIDEALLTCLPLTTSCEAQFLTGHRPIPVHDPRVGDPDLECPMLSTILSISLSNWSSTALTILTRNSGNYYVPTYLEGVCPFLGLTK